MLQVLPDYARYFTAEQIQQHFNIASPEEPAFVWAGPGLYCTETHTVLIQIHRPVNYKLPVISISKDTIYDVHVWEQHIKETILSIDRRIKIPIKLAVIAAPSA